MRRGRRRDETFEPGPTPADAVLQLETTRLGKTTTDRTPTWRGRVTNVSPPTLAGVLSVGETLHPRAGQWRGGWGDDRSQVGVRACRTARGEDCRAMTEASFKTRENQRPRRDSSIPWRRPGTVDYAAAVVEPERSFRWSRRPIGTGRSFPIGLTQIDEALALQPTPSLRAVGLWDHRAYQTPTRWFDESGIHEPPGLTESNFALLASALWQGIKGDPYTPPFTSQLTIFGVDSPRRAETKVLFVERLLPKALAWIAAIDDGAETRRTGKHKVAFFLRDDELELVAT